MTQARGYLRRAIDELPKYAGYESLIATYAQMERHATDALSAWDEGRSPEPETQE